MAGRAELTAARAQPPRMLRDLAGVEGELARLWQANASSDGLTAGPAVLRAATFSLVAVAASEADSQAAAATLAALTAEQPGRVLILWVDPEVRAESLEAWVSMHCRAVGAATQVCGEQVVIRATGRAVERLAGAVAALLLPDCLAAAWWRGGPGPAAVVLDRLVPHVDALLLDGTRFDPERLVRWADRSVPVGDLAWLRGAPWRRVTADCFEPEPLRARLAALTDVRLRFGSGTTGGAGSSVPALLHLGWLAARLRWEGAPRLAPDARGEWQGTLAGPGGPVSVTLSPAPGEVGLVAATLESRSDGFRCTIARPAGDGVTVEMTGAGGEVVRQRIAQAEPDERTLLGHWLLRPRRDELHAAALARVVSFLGSRGPEPG